MTEFAYSHKLLKYLPFCICRWITNRKNGNVIVLNTCGSFAEYKFTYLGDGVYFLFNKEKIYHAKLGKLQHKVELLEEKLKDSTKMKIDEKNIIKIN